MSAAVMASACRGRHPRGLGGMGTPRAATCSASSPASSAHSRARCAWSAYPHAAATSASGRRPSSARDASNRATRWYSFGASPVSSRTSVRQPAPAVADLVGHRRHRSPRVSPASARPTSARGARLAVAASAAISARSTTSARRLRGPRRPAAPAGRPAPAATSSSSSSSPASSRGRYAEQRSGPGRGQPELDPALRVRRGGSPPAQRAAPRPSTTAARRAAAVGPADVQRLAQREHEGQAGRRQPAVHPRRAEVDVVGHQRGDVRRQGGRHDRHADRALASDVRRVSRGRAQSSAVSSSSPSSSRVRSRSSPDLSWPSRTGPIAGAGEPGDRVADVLEQAADDPVAALVDDQLDDGLAGAVLDDPGPRDGDRAVVERHAVAAAAASVALVTSPVTSAT